MSKHFLTGAEVGPDVLAAMIDRAQRLRDARELMAARRGALAGKSIALIFDQPSTRTRMSSEVAIYELGGHPMVLSGDSMQISRGESVRDTAIVTSRFVHAIGIRTNSHATVVDLATHATVPVFNLLTSEHHPLQALADMLTLRQHFGLVEGLRLVYVGDGNNVAASLMVLGAMAGVEVVIATPEGFGPAPASVALAESVASAGGSVELTNDPVAAATGADALYTDVWFSMGDSDSKAKEEALAPFQLSSALLAKAKPEAIAMHCLPAHAGQEITEDVLYGPQSAVFDQAENRLHAQKALLEFILA